jgi:hypothetical protein
MNAINISQAISCVKVELRRTFPRLAVSIVIDADGGDKPSFPNVRF